MSIPEHISTILPRVLLAVGAPHHPQEAGGGMRVGSLFAGIGGFDLAARSVGWRTAWVSEIHPYASRVLARHFPDAPNHGDITQIDFTQVEPVEVLCGGFPCQDISVANSQGKGVEGGLRSGLWRHYARAIGVLRPRYVVVENSPALLVRGLDVVLGDLAGLGYDAWWDCLPLSLLGAPHRRERIWLVAYPQYPGVEIGRRIADALQAGVVTGGTDCLHPSSRDSETGAVATDTPPTVGRGRWAPEPRVARVVYGVPHRVDRAFGLGNAIGPQLAQIIFNAISLTEKGLEPV